MWSLIPVLLILFKEYFEKVTWRRGCGIKAHIKSWVPSGAWGAEVRHVTWSHDVVWAPRASHIMSKILKPFKISSFGVSWHNHTCGWRVVGSRDSPGFIHSNVFWPACRPGWRHQIQSDQLLKQSLLCCVCPCWQSLASLFITSWQHRCYFSKHYDCLLLEQWRGNADYCKHDGGTRFYCLLLLRGFCVTSLYKTCWTWWIWTYWMWKKIFVWGDLLIYWLFFFFPCCPNPPPSSFFIVKQKPVWL